MCDVRSVNVYGPCRYKVRVMTDGTTAGWQIGQRLLDDSEYQIFARTGSANEFRLRTFDTAYTDTLTAEPSRSVWHTYEMLYIITASTTFNIDDALIANHNTNIPDNPLYTRFVSYSQNPTLDIDWSFIAKYVSPEPTHGAWGEEEQAEATFYLNYSDISQNSTMLGTYATFSVLWSSNGSLINYAFEWNFSGSMVADDPVAWEVPDPPQWSNITKELGADVEMYGYAIMWRINATATFSENSTGLQYFTLSALLVTYFVPEHTLLKINGTETNNSTVPYAYPQGLLAEALPATGWSFLNFTLDSDYYNDNPSEIPLQTTNFMEDTLYDFSVLIGTGEGPLNRTRPEDLAGAFVAILIFVPLGIVLVYAIFRRR